ncbi:MAG: hypothetical protein K2O14_07790 [Oscillospiraceae bacterium]|nr:hypothetical protein [Oscillospiraceae bacterium]
MNELKVFSSTEFGELGVMLIDGKEYFPATQCALTLGYKNPKDAIIRHCKGVVKHDLPTNGGTQTVNYIPEGDLYRLIVSSKLPQAEKFERWVFDEVLPSIRHNGGYVGNVEELIAKTATAVATAVIKQIIPILQLDGSPLDDFRTVQMATPRPRRKAMSKISRVDLEVHQTVDDMIRSDRYSYEDIKDYLGEHGVAVSCTAICNYRKRLM